MTRHLQTLFDVACPFCGAGFNEPCRTVPRGSFAHKEPRPLPTFHEQRRVAYRSAKAAEPR